MNAYILFHEILILIIIGVIRFVGRVIVLTWLNPYVNKQFYSHHRLEALWTLLPGVVLIFLGVPSLFLLYWLDSATVARLSVKAVGHQWFWSYEWGGAGACSYDRYMVPEIRGKSDLFRLLDTTAPLILPIGVFIRIYITSVDVLHAWAVPRIGVKADACPGRINELLVLRTRAGNFYGQCSEICGANHRFMPIQVQVQTLNTREYKLSQINS